MKKVALLVVSIMLASCASGMSAAKISLTMGRAGLGVADIGIAEADRENQVKCLKEDPNKGEAYKKCRAKMEKSLAIYDKTRKVAVASFNTADAIIKAHEEKKEGEKIDPMVYIRNGGCVILSALFYIPEKYRKSLQMYIDLALAGLKCPK